MSKLIRDLNIDSDKFFQSIKEQSVKDKLIKFTNDAFQKEVFGTPTFIVNDKIFWGQDRLEYALEEFTAN
jgi:2-hydroxychromene-2-carboxylate isomerase